MPKQLLTISGDLTMLQATVQRLRPMFDWSRILIVTNRSQAAEVRRQLPHVPRQQVLAEPQGRNTLPCIAWAAAWIEARDPQATMVVVPADHVVKAAAAFRRDLREACRVAEGHPMLVTFGIQPTRPDTGYGYIEKGRAIAGTRAARVKRFREKPQAVVARRYLRSRRYYWNAGIFVWRVGVLAQALEVHAPGVRRAFRKALIGGERSWSKRLSGLYRRLPSVAIDVAVMEPAACSDEGPSVAVLAATFDWSDVGSWEAMPEILPCDARGNASAGTLVSIDSSDCIVFAPERLVALLGVEDLVVVDSEDAILICSRERSQQVRQISAQLKQRRLVRHL